MTNTFLANALKERAVILNNMYFDKKLMNREKLLTIDATDNIINLWTELCQGYSSASRTRDCNNCSTFNIPTLSPNHSIITNNGFKSLQYALQFVPKIYNKKCSCGGSATEITNLNDHIFIELDVRYSNNLSKTKRCKLSEIPTSLILGDNEYRLTGIAAYLPNHYLAYYWRTTNRWEIYNDLSKRSVQSCSSQKIEPSAAIYIKFI